MIVGTAGHIDHGKTALVQALTGVNADRLPEEKKRGITIELGYASLSVPGAEPISFIDVPGHEKLVRTMVAGASGMDLALLLIAADDGPMPQTYEHLSILTTLGVSRLAVVLTKIDLVDATTCAQRQQQLKDLLRDSPWPDAPVWSVCAHRGDGIEALRQHLLLQAADLALLSVQGRDHEGFRMDLDRVFTLDGQGTIVAGSITAGVVNVGDMLCLAHQPKQLYRVRSLHHHHRAEQQARAGQRCAIGLVGLERSAVARGQTLCDPRVAAATDRPELWLRLGASETKALRSGTLVHVHVGTQEVMASVALLGQSSVLPGESSLAQLVCQQPVHVWWGDRVVLRDAAATRTLGGGPVIEPVGLSRYRQTPARLSWLAAQRHLDPRKRLEEALNHAPYGLWASSWLNAQGWLRWPFDLAQLGDLHQGHQGLWLVSQRIHEMHAQQVLHMLTKFHQQYPEELGPDTARARRLCLPRMPEAVWSRLIENMAQARQLHRRSGVLHLPAHGEQLRQADLVVAQRALPLLLQGRFDPPWVRDVARDTGLPEMQLRTVMGRMAKSGQVHQIVKDLYYHPQSVQALADMVRRLVQEHGQLSAADFRDATGLGRKRAIQILEFFDRIGFLRRVGDHHLLRPATALFSSPEQAA